VVLATGVADDLPPIEGLDRLWGRTAVHCPYCHGWELRDRPTAVLVSSSLDLLLALKVTHLTGDVAVCLHGRPALSPDEDAMLRAAGIAVWPQPIARLDADGDRLRRIVLTNETSLAPAALYLHPTGTPGGALRRRSRLPVPRGRQRRGRRPRPHQHLWRLRRR